MIGRLARRTGTGPEITARLAALAEAAEIASGRLDPGTTAQAAAVVERAGTRLALGVHLTVVALAGGTGSGKSTLFNALAGEQLSDTGVRRPTTSATQACVWGDDPADALLDWVGANRRHLRGDADRDGDGDAGEDMTGVVLLDLPDHDSTAAEHRVEVDRLVEIVDVLVWVLDPQKYADAAVHDRYLRPLAGHSDVILVVLNQVDLLTPEARAACVADIRRLLTEDGLHEVPVLPTSGRTGEGVAELRALMAARAAEKRSAVLRLSADVDRAADALGEGCASGRGGGNLTDEARRELLGALASAAGADLVVDAVVRDHRRQAAGMTGWPVTSWLRKLRPDPLRRLHLSAATPVAASRTSLPQASAVQHSRVSNAVTAAAESVAGGLPQPWPLLARRAAKSAEHDLPDQLDRAVAGTQLTSGRRPVWWSVVRLVQRLLAAAAAVGLLWLAVLFVIGWLRLPDPPTPEVREVPWPTLLLLAGALTGWLVAVVSRFVARRAARRRGRAARRQLEIGVAAVAESAVIQPLVAEVAAYQRFCDAVSRARGTA